MTNEPTHVSQDPPVISRELLDAYRQTLAVLFLSSLVLIILISVPLIIAETTRVHLRILVFVALSGALGAFFSALTRLYSLEKLPAALIRPDLRLRNSYLVMYALIPPITGMIGAVVFYIVIAAGLIDGPMFQSFRCDLGSANCDSLTGLLSYSPETVKDYAKSLVWGFVSGFSERLVPDALGRLEKGGKPT